MEEKDYNEYESKIQDVDEVEGTDVKINFDFYMHRALIKVQDCLTKDNIKDGLMQYRLLVEHMESLSRAAMVLTKDYDEKIDEFKKSSEYTKETDDFTKSTQLAKNKLSLIMNQVFSNKVALDSVKL